jgi:hypothetical protein
MSSLKLNRIGFGMTAIIVLAIAAVQGCSSSSDDQAAPTAGTGGTSSTTGGKGGTSSTTGGKGGTSSGGTNNNGGTGDVTAEGGAAGAGPGAMCEAAEDHGEAAYLAAHGNKLPTL